MQGPVQSAVERETREGGLGPRARGAVGQGGEDESHLGALRDRPQAVRQVSPRNRSALGNDMELSCLIPRDASRL